jgi:hypothetical protein
MAEQKERIDENLGDYGAGGGGSNDVTSGGGAASGVPDGETAMRMGDVVTRGDVKEDKARLFPEASDAQRQPGNDAPDPKGDEQ